MIEKGDGYITCYILCLVTRLVKLCHLLKSHFCISNKSFVKKPAKENIQTVKKKNTITLDIYTDQGLAIHKYIYRKYLKAC